jgi:peptidylprolyl isomerase
MKQTVLILFMAASTAAASAQTPAKPAAPAAKPATVASTAKPAAPAVSPLIAATIKAPAKIPFVKGLQKPVFTVALRYQEIAIGPGAVAEPNKLYKILYTGWRAADGVKFDSTDDHPRPPVLDKDGKPVLGEDGKPKQGPVQPMSFPQGMGATIIGFDQGFVGMRIGGKRRIFIPWQMGYGTRAMPDRGPDHPGLPAKSDLIFDVELVEVAELPPMPNHGGMMPGARPMPGGHSMPLPAPGAKPVTPGMPATPDAPAKPVAPTAPVQPAAPAPAAQPQPKS